MTGLDGMKWHIGLERVYIRQIHLHIACIFHLHLVVWNVNFRLSPFSSHLIFGTGIEFETAMKSSLQVSIRGVTIRIV